MRSFTAYGEPRYSHSPPFSDYANMCSAQTLGESLEGLTARRGLLLLRLRVSGVSRCEPQEALSRDVPGPTTVPATVNPRRHRHRLVLVADIEDADGDDAAWDLRLLE